MNTLIHADMFFFISSIAFIILGLLLAIIFTYCIKAMHSFTRILEKIEGSMDTIGDATMDLLDELRDNVFFRMLFNPKKKHRAHSSKEKLDK